MEGRYELGDFTLQSGEVLTDAFLGYETHGELNSDKSNVILYPTWYSGNHEENRDAIGEGRALDPSTYFILVPDQFCDGFSSSPSNTPAPHDRARFPLVTPYDNVNAQHQFLTRELGISTIQMVVGFSMSAQQAFHWAAAYPDMVRSIAPICGSAKTSPHDWLHLEAMKLAMQTDAEWRGGDYTSPPEKGLRAFLTVSAGWFASQNFYRKGDHLRIGGMTLSSMQEYLDTLVEMHSSWDANDLLSMLATWQSADVSQHPKFQGDLAAALGAIECPAIVLPCETDLYFPPEDSELAVSMMPDAELRVIPSDSGHLAGHPGMATAEDNAFIDQALADLLGRIEG